MAEVKAEAVPEATVTNNLKKKSKLIYKSIKNCNLRYWKCSVNLLKILQPTGNLVL